MGKTNNLAELDFLQKEEHPHVSFLELFCGIKRNSAKNK